MYPKLRKTVEEIIEKHGNITLDQFYRSSSKLIKVKKKGYLDFVIEKSGDVLYIGYYTIINGDMVPDPIFMFVIHDGQWYPIRLEQMLLHTPIGVFEDGKYVFNPKAFRDVKSFANLCSKEWRTYYLTD